MSNALRKARMELLDKELEELENTNSQEENKQDKPIENNPEEETYRKRYGDLRRHSQKVENELREEIEKVKSQLETAAKGELKLPKTEEEVKSWMSKYPDVAGIIETLILQRTEAAKTEVKKDFERVKKLEDEIKRERDLAILFNAHPDFDSIRKTQEFHDWLTTKSKRVRDIMYEDGADVYDAIDVIDMYKTLKIKTKPEKDNKKETTDAAKNVETKGRTVPADANSGVHYFSETEVAKMSEREYAKHEAEIEKQIREGTFVYDSPARA